MKKNKVLTVVCCLIFLVGIIIILKSVSLGNAELNRYNGNDIIDATTNLVRLEQFIINFRSIGAMISILSGVGLLLEIRK